MVGAEEAADLFQMSVTHVYNAHTIFCIMHSMLMIFFK